MSAFIRLGKQTARRILNHIAGAVPMRQESEELRRALAPSTKRTRARTAQRAQKTEKRQTKAEETRAIRVPVFARAPRTEDGVPLCEWCRARLATDLHHVFGRKQVRQAVSNCLALCRDCHRNVTNNYGGAAACWEAMARILERHGYAAEVRRCREKILADAELAAAAEVMGVRT